MLVDDIRTMLAKKNTGHLFWMGYDTRFPKAEYEIANDGLPQVVADPLFVGDADEGEQLNSILTEAVLYDCVPLIPTVAKLHEGKLFRFTSDCFGPLPPFPLTGIEDKVDASNRSLTLFQSSAVTGDTPSVPAYFLRENALKRPGFGPEAVHRVRIEDAGPSVALTTAKWMVSVSVLLPMGYSDFLFADNFLAYFCDGQGKLLTSPLTNPALNLRMQTKPDDTTTLIMEQILGVAKTQFNRAAAILNLMALRNVSSQLRAIDKPLQKARLRRGAPPLTEYHVLTVTLPGKARQGGAVTLTAKTGEPLPLQLIPGQYRDYREHGLFGKYKGIFWVPAHARGNANEGVIKKQYSAQPGPLDMEVLDHETHTRTRTE